MTAKATFELVNLSHSYFNNGEHAMQSSAELKIYNTLLALLFLIGLQSCAVLTSSQVDEVERFSIAASDYSDLPGAVIRMDSDIILARALYDSAGIKNLADSGDRIDDGINTYIHLNDQAAAADVAVGVIAIYVGLLKKLTSEDFTEELEQQTITLGAEIDSGIQQFNEQPGPDVDSFGAAVAAVVRAGGGILIRYKQVEALKVAVEGGQKVMSKMSSSITSLMDDYVRMNRGTDIKLKGAYLAALDIQRYNYSYDSSVEFSKTLIKAKSITPLAEKTKKAMETLVEAHTELYNKMQKRQDLTGTIETITVLAGEVQAAQRLRKEIDAQAN